MGEQGIAVFQGARSSHVFSVNGLPGWVFKIVSRPITVALLAELLGKQGELNEKGYPVFASHADEYVKSEAAKKAGIDPYTTYHALSLFLGVERARKAQEEYSLSRVSIPQTYGYLLNPSQTAHDRNCIVVQERIGGTLLPNYLDALQVRDDREHFLKELYKLILGAKMWQMHDIIVSPDGKKMSPVDLEGRDRYWPRMGANESEHHGDFFITPGESKHLMLCAMEEMAQYCQQHTELFEAWQNNVRNHEEAKSVLRGAPHIAKLYSCLKEASSTSLPSSSSSSASAPR